MQVDEAVGAPGEPPAAAVEVFGDALDAAVAYAGFLAGPGVLRGLLGPREAERIWERHLLNCAVVADRIPRGAAVADIGSGAGLPGLVVAIVRPDLRVTLVEPMARRTAFLDEAVTMLALGDRVDIVRSRAEDHARGAAGRYDVVTARAVAPLRKLVDLAWPLLRLNGCLLAMKGQSAEAELGDLGRPARVERLGVGVVSPPATVVIVERRPGEPSQRRPAGGRKRQGGPP